MSTLYVRNLRPNAVLVRLPSLNNLKYTVERRGSRADTVALPSEAREDPVVATFLQRGILEEVSKETFMSLASRPEDKITVGPDKKPRREDSLPLKKRKAEEEVNIPIHNPEESRTPFIIADEDLRDSVKFRTPRPEFDGRIPTTEEDLKALEAARRAVEEAARQVTGPEDETAELRAQVASLTTLVQELLARNPEIGDVKGDVGVTPKAKKATTSGTKKTRATARTKS